MRPQAAVTSGIDAQFRAWWRDVQRVVEEIKRDDQQRAPRFNVFDVLGIDWDERHHSRFLAALLDPHGSHGQGNKFLGAFLSQERFTQFSALAERRWTVRTEERHDGDRFDIALRCADPRVVIVIENKVGAPEGDCQCLRYLGRIDREVRKEKGAGRLIYLTPDRRPAESLKGRDGDYVRLGYDDVSRCLAAVCEGLPSRLRSVVEQYADLATVLSDTTEGDLLMATDSKLVEFLRKKENVEAAFRVAAAMGSLRERLLGEFFGWVKKAMDRESGGVRAQCFPDEDEDVKRATSPSLAFYPRKADLGIGAQIWKDELLYGVCWRNTRQSRSIPAAAKPVLKIAEHVLNEKGRSDTSWLVYKKRSRFSVETACRDPESRQIAKQIAKQVGRDLGRLIVEAGPAIKKANAELTRR